MINTSWPLFKLDNMFSLYEIAKKREKVNLGKEPRKLRKASCDFFLFCMKTLSIIVDKGLLDLD